MIPATQAHSSSASVAAGGRRGGLARALQEAFTVTVRLRSNRQVASDSASFRTHLKHLLAAADREARQAGYAPDDVKMAVYAFIAFLDESVLNSSQAMFADWPRQPLQEEVFGDHMGGENFFRNLRQLLARQDSEDLADLLEVHQMCMLLGFRGRYGTGNTGELESFLAATDEKIRRIRGPEGDLAPSWRPPAEERVPESTDPWLRRLVAAAVTTALVALVLFVVYRMSLAPGVEELEALADRMAAR